MKIVTIVGIRKSGKTSTVENLIFEIRKRGLSVGTCKTVFCPSFSMDQPNSNTARHLKAGSQMVCARAKNETTLIIPGEQKLTDILRYYDHLDYVLLEGDYLSPVPRIVCAHDTSDALLRQNELTLCFSGRISTKTEIQLPLPCFNPLTQGNELLDFIDQHVPETELSEQLNVPLPAVEGVTGDGFCQCGCHHHERKQQNGQIKVTVNGLELTLNDDQRALIRSWSLGG